jgi:small subunit ribosomal protein S6
MTLRRYHTLTVLKPDLAEEALLAAVDRIRGVVNNNGGKVLKIEHRGRQRMSYRIRKYPHGVYIQFSYLMPPDLVREVERNCRITDAFLRFQTHMESKEIGETGDVALDTPEAFMEQLREARRREEEQALLEQQQALEEQESGSRDPYYEDGMRGMDDDDMDLRDSLDDDDETEDRDA